MRILILSPYWPFPADNGGKLRVASVASFLARHHEVVFLCFTNNVDSLVRHPDAERFQEVCGVPFPSRSSRLRHWLSPIPAGPQEYDSPEMNRRVKEIIARFAPEVLLVDDPLLTRYVVPYPNLVKILDYVCVDTLQFERLQALSSGLLQALWRLRRAKFAAYLRRIARLYDLCLVNSEEDRNALHSAAPAWRDIEFLPNGLDLVAYPLGLATPRRNTLVFPGSLLYPPNFDAASYFIRDILPYILAQEPAVTLQIGRAHF